MGCIVLHVFYSLELLSSINFHEGDCRGGKKPDGMCVCTRRGGWWCRRQKFRNLSIFSPFCWVNPLFQSGKHRFLSGRHNVGAWALRLCDATLELGLLWCSVEGFFSKMRTILEVFHIWSHYDHKLQSVFDGILRDRPTKVWMEKNTFLALIIFIR